jgi:predicted permease
MVFHRVPYATPDRLVEIRGGPRGGRAGDNVVTAVLLDEWRKQTTLFAGVHGYLMKSLFVVGDDGAELVRTVDVTVGLLEMLGASARWGRLLAPGDEHRLSLQPVVIADDLARERFGDPARAIGQRVETTAQPLLVVGVMRADFRFPTGTQRIWRALDPQGELARGFVGVATVARLADGVPRPAASAAVEQRAAAVGQAAGHAAYVAQLGPLRMAQAGEQQQSMFMLLLAAAVCMVLIACANVASLELTDAIHRARSYAVLLALGATRAAIARIAVFECGWVIAVAAAIAAPLTIAGGSALPEYLPERFTGGVVNRIDLDTRAVLFMLAVVGATWFVTAVPLALAVRSARVIDLLQIEGLTAAGSRPGARTRQALTIAQVGIAVLLLASSIVFVRSYAAVVALDKGFDTAGLASVTVTIPPQLLADNRALADEIVQRLNAYPGVGAMNAAAPSASTFAQLVDQVELDTGHVHEGQSVVMERDVVPEYFSFLRIPLLSGRGFADGEPASHVIVSSALATQFWPAQDPIGRRFRLDPKRPWRTVIGVAGQVDVVSGPNRAGADRALQVYVPRQPPPPPSPQPRPVAEAGGSYGSLSLMVRVDSPRRLEDVVRTVRQSAGRLRVAVELVDDAYARQYDGLLLTTRIVSGFGLLAFLVGTAGVYGVMMLLVAQRTREIGIRVALGASWPDVFRLVLASSARLTLAGTLAGIAAAVGASRWIESQLYGAQGVDPLVLTAVGTLVILTAVVATLHPARTAARVQPSALLRI